MCSAKLWMLKCIMSEFSSLIIFTRELFKELFRLIESLQSLIGIFCYHISQASFNFPPQEVEQHRHSGFHSCKDQWANILAFGGVSGKPSPVGHCTGPSTWLHYFSGCAALTFDVLSTMDRERDERHRTRRARGARVPENDGWGEHSALHARGASDEARRRQDPNFSGVAGRLCGGACRSGQGRLLLPGSRGCCSVFLLWGDFEVLGAGGQPGGRAQEALPHVLLRSRQSCGKYSAPGRVLGFRGRPAVESAPEDDHGRPGDGRTGGLPRDGGRGFPAHHFPQLAHGSLGPARRSGEGGIFLHRCWLFLSKAWKRVF